MRILLTNDDGFDAPGLAALARRLGGEHELHVIAPDRERSGVGHAFTLGHGLQVKDSPEGPSGVKVASARRCSGMPVDCVKLGLLTLLDPRPDWVVSGINKGGNLTIDTLYSGTVGAALEGHIMGVPSIAISLAVDFTAVVEDIWWETAAAWCARVLSGEGWEELEPGEACLNVNVPPRKPGDVKGIRRAAVADARYNDRYRVETGDDGQARYFLEGELNCQDPRQWADVVAVREGYVSITPMGCDLTDHALLKRMRSVS